MQKKHLKNVYKDGKMWMVCLQSGGEYCEGDRVPRCTNKCLSTIKFSTGRLITRLSVCGHISSPKLQLLET